jgi:hypothetical protein
MISKEKAAYIRSVADASGHIEPMRVIEAARDPTSPIHNDFPWDDAVAANAHRLDIARELIRFVKLEVKTETETVVAPYYVPDPERPPKSQRYVALTVAAQEREMAMKVLADELNRIAAAIRRAQEVALVCGLLDYLTQQLLDVTQLRTASERRKDEAAAKKTRRREAGGKTLRAEARA